MLVATPKGAYLEGRQFRCHGIVNRGGWFGENWLVVISIANALHAASIVEAEHEQSAIDELADSPTWSHLIDCDESEDCDRAGNDSHPVNLDYVTILTPCEVNYFAQDTGEWH